MHCMLEIVTWCMMPLYILVWIHGFRTQVIKSGNVSPSKYTSPFPLDKFVFHYYNLESGSLEVSFFKRGRIPHWDMVMIYFDWKLWILLDFFCLRSSALELDWRKCYSPGYGDWSKIQRLCLLWQHTYEIPKIN